MSNPINMFSLFAGIDQFKFNASLPEKTAIPYANQFSNKHTQYSQEVPTLNSLFKTSMPSHVGASLFSGPNYKGNDPVKMNNSQVLEDGGFILGAKIAQTEKYKGVKEQIVTPTGEIFDVRATKSHEKMKDDEVTDILPDMAFIGSARPKHNIFKKDAEQISFGFGVTEYNEKSGPGAPPKEYLYSDVFKKSKETPAEIFKNIKKKFPTTDREDDPFADATNLENKAMRLPYMLTTVALSNSENTSPELFKDGGPVRKVRKYQGPDGGSGGGGGIWSLIAEGFDKVLDNIVNVGTAIQSAKQAKKNQQRIEQVGAENMEDIDQATLAQILATSDLDSSYSFLDLSKARAEGTSGYDTAIQTIKNAEETQQSRIQGMFHNLSSSLFNNTSSFSRGAAAAASLLPNTLRASSDVAMRSSLERGNLGIARGLFESGLSEKEALDLQTGKNYQTDFENRRTSQYGDIVTNRYNQRMANRANQLNATLVNSGQAAAAQQQFATNFSAINRPTYSSSLVDYTNSRNAAFQTTSAQQTNYFQRPFSERYPQYAGMGYPPPPPQWNDPTFQGYYKGQ